LKDYGVNSVATGRYCN